MAGLPENVDEILATGIMSLEFEAAWKAKGEPPGDMPADVATLKTVLASSLPALQQTLAACRPADITETEINLTLSTGFMSRLLICHRTSQSATAPPPSSILLLFHGGAHVLGFPEFDLPLARNLALAHNAVVICPSVRHAPEHAFPATVDDAWAVLQAVASDAVIPGHDARSFLPAHADARAGFIVGGTSSGANLADVVVHLARDDPGPSLLARPVTGQWLVCGAFMDPGRVPEKYRVMYLARVQNGEAPVVNARFLEAFTAAIQPDRTSRLWAPFLWDEKDVAKGHTGMPPAYFQVCGLDGNRDDSLIYERVLREECGVPTRVDLYAGLPHCWWDSYPELEASERRMRDAVEGLGWLLMQVRRV